MTFVADTNAKTSAQTSVPKCSPTFEYRYVGELIKEMYDLNVCSVVFKISVAYTPYNAHPAFQDIQHRRQEQDRVFKHRVSLHVIMALHRQN
ncbi:hypothetical protein BTUL_0054g00030 [Botrytis tulipae]|uniref:Uncharacterized protein n=1 Tax=Botrytis tulipae TaxID=87230 RepID=A0A4Z1EQ74_9HELO|nr:hypothetical protein BTUL_0054g00030 [Botrytis tulipae]